jgi:hypothetical protein
MGSPEVPESARAEEETEEGLSFKRSKPPRQSKAVAPQSTGRPTRVRKPGPSRFPDTSTDREIRAKQKGKTGSTGWCKVSSCHQGPKEEEEKVVDLRGVEGTP